MVKMEKRNDFVCTYSSSGTSQRTDDSSMRQAGLKVRGEFTDHQGRVGSNGNGSNGIIFCLIEF